jgi:hypothetical protein
VAWQGQFQDKYGHHNIILEAIADHSLWIWHAHGEQQCSSTSLTVSPRIGNMLRGHSSDIRFEVNGRQYNRYYLLTDGIYPRWSCFVQPIYTPQGEKEFFMKIQFALRNDVEHAFGVLQARWEIVKNPVRQWDLDTINNVMFCCIILYNMIVQDEVGEQLESVFAQPAAWGSRFLS